MLPFIDHKAFQEVDERAFVAALRSLGPRSQLERAGFRQAVLPKKLVAFGTFRSDSVFPGYRLGEVRRAARERRRSVSCQTAVEIQSAVGCPYDCSYCPYAAFVCVRLDVEHFADRVMRIAADRPQQKLFKLNNRTDTFALEPEHGVSAALVDRFAKLDGRYLLLYAKGDEVSQLAGLDHRGKTIVSFTLSPEPVAQLLEQSAPSPALRLTAMTRARALGYPIRVRLSPIVPIEGWRDAYRDLIVDLAKEAPVEMATLWTLSMVEFEDLERIVPRDALDPAAYEAARRGAEEMKGLKGAPFPPAFRQQIYRHIARLLRENIPRALLSLCLETEEVWRGLADVVTRKNGGAFLCNCGPGSTPPRVERAVATPSDR